MGADFYFRKRIQDIGLHHEQLRYAVDHDRIFQSRQVDPSASSWSPGGGAEFVAFSAHQVAVSIKQLRGERTTSHPGTIGFKNPVYLTDPGGGHSQSCT